jgi:hypothetical protein
MRRRYSVLVREFGSKHEVELLQVDSNPNPIAAALRQKRENGVNRYGSIRVVDNGEPAS